jgi:hypothetical protein
MIKKPTPSARRRFPGHLGTTRIQANGKMTAEQAADKQKMEADHPGAVYDDWSTGTFSKRHKVSPRRNKRDARPLERARAPLTIKQ